VSKRFVGLFVACAAVAMIVGGCGGSDDNTDSTDSAELTKAQFLKQGNAICAKANEEVGKEFEEFAKENKLSEGKEPTEELLAEAVEEILLPSVTQQVEEIRELGVPAGEEKQVDKILTAAEEGIEEAEDEPASAAAQTGGPFDDADKLATAYGLKRCGE
jgi:hypothetical protein